MLLYSSLYIFSLQVLCCSAGDVVPPPCLALSHCVLYICGVCDFDLSGVCLCVRADAGTVEEALENHEAVLIHSVDGASRACFCAAVYFILKYRWYARELVTRTCR